MAFRIFRLITGVLLTALAIVMIAEGASAVMARAEGDLPPAAIAYVVGAILLLGIYYYALWSTSNIRKSLENIFSIPELLKKIAFTLILLCIYRIGFHVPLPGLDQQAMTDYMSQQSEGAIGQAMQMASMFTG